MISDPSAMLCVPLDGSGQDLFFLVYSDFNHSNAYIKICPDMVKEVPDIGIASCFRKFKSSFIHSIPHPTSINR